METIDILIPVYNCEKFIEKCLDSLLSQTYKALRIIIVDDGSTDKSAILVKNYQKKYKNIEIYHKNNENSISKTRNFLLTKIESKYFTFFDADDWAEDNYIETLYNTMKHFDVDMSLCGKVRHKENKYFSSKKLNANSKVFVFNKQDALAEMLSSNLYNGTVYCKLFKTKFLGETKFDENIHYGEDLDFCFSFMNKCESFALATNKLYHYIVRKGSIVTSKFNTKKLSCLDCYDKIISDVKQNPELLLCAKSMQGLIAIELLYYTFRDKFKDKQLKKKLKKMIKDSVPLIRKNKRLCKINKKAPLVWWLTKFM